jgi:hypothetical protein
MSIDRNLAERADAHPDAAAGEVVLAYRRAPLMADYFRAGAGLALSAVPLATMAPIWPVAIGLASLVGLFGLFLAQTWRRQHSRVRLARGGVALVNGAARSLAWDELDAMRLRWFGSRRQGQGWLELELHGAGQRLVLTSALDGFDTVVADAFHAARANNVPLESATRANVAALLGQAVR